MKINNKKMKKISLKNSALAGKNPNILAISQFAQYFVFLFLKCISIILKLY